MPRKAELVSAARSALARSARGPLGSRIVGRAVRELEMASRPPVTTRVPLPGGLGGGPHGALRLNRLCGPDVWDDPLWMMYNRLLGLDGRMHRKDFEWVHCIYGLESLGVMGPRTTVLGVGAGREPTLYYFANRGALCVATDIYEGHFAPWDAKEDFPEHPERYAPFPYRREALVPLRADGRVLPFEDEVFDVVYSLSSIEHFGGHHAAAQSMREMARVVRPGGVVCVATEWILEGGDHFEYFTPQDFQEYVVEASGLEPVEPFDTTPPPRALIDDPHWMQSDTVRFPCIVVGEGALRWTSAMVFLRKPEDGRLVPAGPRPSR